MSGFTFGGGFGANNNNNNNQTGGGFSGFGANNNTNPGFGGTGTTGFGATNNTTSGGLFGGGGTGFGSSGGGFGTTNSGFGAKPGGFGATTTAGSSLFGGGQTSTTATSGFGGFGTPANNTTTTFGANNNTGSGGLFGAAKPAFGATPTNNSNLFGGGGGNTASPFGGGAATGAFGSPASTALAGNVGECQGTGQTAFQAFVEKEPNSTSNQQNAFQSICFQAPYQKFSPEELRLADYNQGRKFGNASNQPGAFGATNFGGFGTSNTASTGFGATNTTTGTGLFGGGATSTPFGGTQPATTGFGANNTTSTNMFGAPKPTGLFGAQNTTPAAGGNLFGGTNTATGGFGSTAGGFGASNNSNTGSTMFGGNNNAASKPNTFGFGTSTPATTTTGFGATASTGGFGGGNLFGNNTQQANTTSGFGAQPAATTSFAGFGAPAQNTANTGLFGSAPKPAGSNLFGTSTTPAANTNGGIFGNNQATANSNPFGGTANAATNSLFGAPKPATPSLFGGATNQTNTNTSSLFGGGFGANQPAQQAPGTSLFGGLNNNTQKTGMFGQPAAQPNNSLFGGNNGAQQLGNSLFSTSNTGQPQQQNSGTSMFGANSMFSNSQPQSLTASLGDNTAFGSSSLFSNLAATQVNNPGPIATPLSSAMKQKKAPAALPMYKLSTPSASRFSTPPRRGFGFSYSNYNSPASASSTASTPGTFGNSLLGGGGSFSRTLSKSVSTSSLRRSFTAEDSSILSPGAFSTSSNSQRFGSLKKLSINRSLRQDLFAAPTPTTQQPGNPPPSGILKKRVSFGNGTSSESGRTSLFGNSATPSAEDMGYLRPRPNGNTNGTSSTTSTTTSSKSSPPEMEQVPGPHNSLTVVNEEEPAPAVQPPPATDVTTTQQEEDKDDGYWMEPSIKELEKMSRAERGQVKGLKVGRRGFGTVQFEGAVDLNKLNPTTIMGNLVVFDIRNATVYPIENKKPPQGSGLNIPSVIKLEQSWPRSKDNKSSAGERGLQRHKDRLKKVPNTEFLDYDSSTGAWTFRVQHFTTYGCPDDEESGDFDETNGFGQSTLSDVPETPRVGTPGSAILDQSFASTSQFTTTESDPEDTFDFRKKKSVAFSNSTPVGVVIPGSFDDESLYENEEMMDEYEEQIQESFLGERSVGSPSENGVEEPMDQDDVFGHDGSVSIVDQEMAGTYPDADITAELDQDSQDEDVDMDLVVGTPGAATRARFRSSRNAGTPMKQFKAGDDWANTLQNTVSPRKQDRALLKSLIDIHGNEAAPEEPMPMPRRVVSDNRGFATSIDLMNSLFGQARSPIKPVKAPVKSKGFEWPYSKRPKTGDHDTSNMDANESAFHESMKPSWGADGTLVYAAPSSTKPFGRSSRRSRDRDGLLVIQKGGVVSEHRDVHFAKFSHENAAPQLEKHKALCYVDVDEDGLPSAGLDRYRFRFVDFVDSTTLKDAASTHEKLVWQLATILFDEIHVPPELQGVKDVSDRLRKDNLSSFWQNLVDEASSRDVNLSKNGEEKAIACLSGHKVADACAHLASNGDYHLATLVALIGSKDSMKEAMRKQLNQWQKDHVLSEFSQPIRAIYEILSGNVSVCEGQKGEIENRTDSFIISKRFGLDWRQAFGLRLWYSLSTGNSLDAAVDAFAKDLAQDKETARPIPWYIEQKLPLIWDDRSRRRRYDLLWGLLRLYSFDNTGIEDILCPENCQLSPLDMRLSWQLCQALRAGEVVDFKGDADAKMDQVSLSFAAQLTNEGNWLDTVFVLLHLNDKSARQKAIQDHIARHAGLIGDGGSSSFTTLVNEYQVPASWVWEAKALYKRSVENDFHGEVECLINAGSFNEAHRTFTKDVAPKTIIELDYSTLRTLLDGFSGKEESIAEWHLGGEIYKDFLQLLDSQKKGHGIDGLVLERLLSGLPAVVEKSRHPAFLEMVAIETISDVVAKSVVALGKSGEKYNLNKVLRLPLTEDKYLKHSVELSLEYYRGLMASAR